MAVLALVLDGAPGTVAAAPTGVQGAVQGNHAARADVLAAPVLTQSVPADNATAVSVATDLVLIFDQAIAVGTGNIIVSDGAGDTRTFDVTDSSQVHVTGSTLVVKAAADLEPATGYHVQVAAGAVTNGTGDSFAGISDTTTLNFTTGNTIYAVGKRGNNSGVGSGTSANPYESIGNATVQADPGDTIYVLDAGATIARSYTLAAQGTAASPITIKPAPGNTSPYSFTGANGWIVDGAAYLVIEGVEFYGSSDLADH